MGGSPTPPMGGGMGASQDGDGDADGCPPGCLPVPLDSLAQPDDKEQMHTPGEGDSGTMQVDYTVEGVNGQTAYVKPSAINGHQLDEGEDNQPNPDDEAAEADQQEGDALRQQAGAMGQ